MTGLRPLAMTVGLDLVMGIAGRPTGYAVVAGIMQTESDTNDDSMGGR